MFISVWKNFMLQDANSYVMENLIMFHDLIMIVIVMIMIFIMYLIFIILLNSFVNRFMYHGELIEIVWIVLPVCFLLILVFPSLKILYLMDDVNYPLITLKVIGHQWYWSYEYEGYGVEFDSFMNNMSCKYLFRLLDVDNNVVLPIYLYIRFLITSLDVIHSFTVPSIGFKVDAIPGRLNQVMTLINRPGLYYGQCSEICGVNHSFMPIVIESTSLSLYINWLNDHLK